MARSTFKVLFYLKRQAEQNGKAPIMGRITINGTISQFSCKLSISPKLWDTKANKATGKSVVAQRINEKLENIKTNIGKQYQRICDRDSYVTAEKVKNAWLGFRDGYQLLLQTFDEYLNEFREEPCRQRPRGLRRWKTTRKQHRRLAAFLQYEYKVEDIPFRELKREFIEKYVVYLSTVRSMLPGSIAQCDQETKTDELYGLSRTDGSLPTLSPDSEWRVTVSRPTFPVRIGIAERSWTLQVPNYKTAIVQRYIRVLLLSRDWPMPM